MEKGFYHLLPVEGVLKFLSNHRHFAIFESALCDEENHTSLICYGLLHKKYSYNGDSFFRHIKWAEKMINSGYFVICAIPYETGLSIEPVFQYKEKNLFPAIFFVFKHNIIFDHVTGRFSENFPVSQSNNLKTEWNMKELCLDTKYQEYINNIRKIKKYIENGDTYQVNYTVRCKFRFTGSVYGMYLDLRNMQQVPYSAFIKDDKRFILSFSPELFFRKNGSLIITRPMKGTIKRGKNQKQDDFFRNKLFSSIKDRAENLMIVDMMRNDLGRICKFGTVVTHPLFHIEKYKTLFQMTSTVTGTLKNNINFGDIFRALFPSASITGAPKIRTMQIISELEKNPRKIYTGTIGIIKPDHSAVFNVAIRTILIDENKGEMGTGGGIVYDSKPEKEYKECLLKASFLISACRKIQLIETFRWTSKEGYFLFDLHLKRLSKSAEFFHFDFDLKKIVHNLEKTAERFDSDKIYRVRLLVSPYSTTSITYQEITLLHKKQKAVISNKKINSENIFLYHKTTVRDVYDRAHKFATDNGYFDVIFKNKENQITEGSITNVFIEKNGILYTPPVSCGLLPGILRQHLLKNGIAKEKIIDESEIFSADRIFLGNSVRGLVEVEIE